MGNIDNAGAMIKEILLSEKNKEDKKGAEECSPEIEDARSSFERILFKYENQR